jgi:uncharacterized protein (TIGR02118 family)
MIKVVWAAMRKPGMPDEAFYRHWTEVHGTLGARVSGMRRYVQHHTLPEARGGEPAPTHDGASIAWFDDLASLRSRLASVEWRALSNDAPNLFDRSTPMSVVVATERPVVDGATAPGMVKAIYVAARQPGLSVEEFQERWFAVHGALCARVPALRRYVQNHALPEAYSGTPVLTHDGWSELWFDDLDSLRAAVASAEWLALREDGRTLFAQPMSVVVARERTIVG